ncbi:MAG TPA: hypothetical protein VEZ90_09795, partial [Blastocatellia bacterium]|nr:hypothetical protein [Blastocatellia bacterium]
MRIKSVSSIFVVSAVCVIIGWFVFGRTGVSRAQASKDEQMQNGLQFRLSEGGPAASSSGAETAAPSASASPLSAEATDTLLKRLTPLKAAASDQKEFALRPGSLPPPKTGKVINAD